MFLSFIISNPCSYIEEAKKLEHQVIGFKNLSGIKLGRPEMQVICFLGIQTKVWTPLGTDVFFKQCVSMLFNDNTIINTLIARRLF